MQMMVTSRSSVTAMAASPTIIPIETAAGNKTNVKLTDDDIVFRMWRGGGIKRQYPVIFLG